MIKPLRKRHRQAWLLLAVALPAGIILSWLVIPNQQPVRLLQANDIKLFPVIVRSRDKLNYQVTIRSDKENKEWQLEWVNKKVLTFPSAVIYKTSSNASDGRTLGSFKPEQAELIGRIETKGSYVFPLHKDTSGILPLHFILYDFIHQQIIDTINFQP